MVMDKQKSFIILLLAVVFFAVLAAGLSGMILKPGQPFALPTALQSNSDAGALGAGSDWAMWVMRGVIAFAVIMLPVYIISSLFTAKGRKNLLSTIILLGSLLLFMEFWQRNKPQTSTDEGFLSNLNMPGQTEEAASNIQATVFPATPPDWLVAAVIFVVAVVLVILLIGGFLYYQNRRKQRQTSLDLLAQQAEQAIEDLQTGGDFRNAIMRCYQQMCQVVQDEMGLARAQFMTPREFESALVRKGLPQEALDRLTHLFEDVRYGGAQVRQVDEGLAIVCLEDIVSACRSLRKTA